MPAVPPEDTSAHPFSVLQRGHRTFFTHFTGGPPKFPSSKPRFTRSHQPTRHYSFHELSTRTMITGSVVVFCFEEGPTSDLTFSRRPIDADALFAFSLWPDFRTRSWNFGVSVLSSPRWIIDRDSLSVTRISCRRFTFLSRSTLFVGNFWQTMECLHFFICDNGRKKWEYFRVISKEKLGSLSSIGSKFDVPSQTFT